MRSRASTSRRRLPVSRNSAPSNSVRKSSGCVAAFETLMKFPLRLTLDLWRGRLFRTGYNGEGDAPIFHLPAAWLPALHENGFDHSASGDTHTAADSVRTAAKTEAPVLWIGGSEPLDHAEVGRVAFALNARGRNLFLH